MNADDAESQRPAFERYIVARQRAKGFGEFLTDAEFVRRDASGHYVKWQSDWETWLHCHNILVTQKAQP